MTTLNKKLVRDLVRSKWLLLAVVAMIGIGTGSFAGIAATVRNLTAARDSYYAQTRMADFWVDLKKVPVGEARRALDIPGIAAVRDRIAMPVLIDLADEDRPVSGMAISMPERPVPVINDLIIRRGTYFTGRHDGEVIVSEKFAEARRINPGQFISLIMSGQKKELYVAGTAISAENIYLVPPGSAVADPALYGVFYVRQGFAEDVFDFRDATNNIVGIVAADRQPEITAILDQIGRRLAAYGVYAATPLSLQGSNLTLASELGGLQTMATILPLMFLLVSALVLNVLMMRFAEQQRVIVGTFKALGYTNRQVLLHFLKFGLVVGGVGGAAGIGMGVLIEWMVTGIYRQVFEFPSLSCAFYGDLSLGALAISIFFGVLGAVRGAQHVTRLSPAEAMRQASPAKGGHVLLEDVPWLWRRFDFRWQVVLRLLFRQKIRTVVSICAAVMGAALTVVAFGFVDSMREMIRFEFEQVMNYDYEIVFKSEVGSSVLDDVRRLPGVRVVEPVLSVFGDLSHGLHRKKLALTGIGSSAALTRLFDPGGRMLEVPPVGLVLGRHLAGELNAKPGDRLLFVPAKGARRPVEIPVIQVIENMVGIRAYADIGFLNRLIHEAGAMNAVQLKAQQNEAERRAFFRSLKNMPQLQSLVEARSQKIALKQQFDKALLGMAVVMIVFAGVIFCGSILNASLIALAERQREIATYRVLGYCPLEIGSLFARENFLVNTAGAVIGLPVGYALLAQMMAQYTNDAYAMPTCITAGSYIWTLVLALLFTLAAQVVVQGNINALSWQQALSMKE